MKWPDRKNLILIILLLNVFMAKSQQDSLPNGGVGNDLPGRVRFTTEEASEYLSRILQENHLWDQDSGQVRLMLIRLMEQYREPYDSITVKLEEVSFEPLFRQAATSIRHDTFPLRWLNPNTFIIDTTALEKDPLVQKTSIIFRGPHWASIPQGIARDSMLAWFNQAFRGTDTVSEMVIDTAYLVRKGVQIFRKEGATVTPSPVPEGDSSVVRYLSDSSKMVVIRERHPLVEGVGANNIPRDPVKIHGDSLQRAVETLQAYIHTRDSVQIWFRDPGGSKVPFWMRDSREDLFRYWLKNSVNDSITLWVGNPSKHVLSLLLEEGVDLKRPEKKSADDIPLTNIQPAKTLARIKPLEEAPYSWKHGINSSVSLNQNHLSNWSKGGVSSFSSMVDVLAKSDYTHRKKDEQWNSSGRLRYGSIRTKEQGFRTSNDILEINSQFNKVMKEKLDFSALLYMKTQVARGYNYPNDSVVVSKFLNPGAFTIGIGAEYKPWEKTRITITPLSYRNTFVLDTVNINQELHGIEADMLSRQEFGGQLLVRHSMTILEGLEATTSARFFSSYLNKPQNIDVDWEFSLEKKINWYFTIRLNLHMIYDDDMRFPVMDVDGKPVLWPDGRPRTAARLQLNEFLGLTLSFRI
ncbi:MAG: DUF3078 domain-containing protein [Bacteroidales bacterium]